MEYKVSEAYGSIISVQDVGLPPHDVSFYLPSVIDFVLADEVTLELTHSIIFV
jgi:hypothetical protein